jgi:hypothetical protein
MTLVLLFKGIFATYILTWLAILASFAVQYFNILLKETYWNYTYEKEFMIKLKCVISSVDNDFVFFSPQNLAYKLNFIYNNMSVSDKRKFRREIFQNGLRPRIKRLIDRY